MTTAARPFVAVPPSLLLALRTSLRLLPALLAGLLAGLLPGLLPGVDRIGDGGLVVAAATALAVLLSAAVLAGHRGAVTPRPAPVAAARAAADRAERGGSPRQLHPDAAGHARPRAPGPAASARPV